MMANALEGENTVFNHVGICVTDVERSRKFYEEVLRFRYWWELEAPDEGTSQLLQIPAPVGLRAMYLVRDSLVLELLHYSEAEAQPFRQRDMNEPGLTHLSFSVGDIPAVLEKVPRYGGQVLADTDMTAAIMIRDPDGQLIELTSAGWLDVLPPLPPLPD
jgi:catechol 2,3-dioxygenase-like lactoylglutathione lyase family enzyme